jgi:hypothetical protein
MHSTAFLSSGFCERSRKVRLWAYGWGGVSKKRGKDGIKNLEGVWTGARWHENEDERWDAEQERPPAAHWSGTKASRPPSSACTHRRSPTRPRQRAPANAPPGSVFRFPAPYQRRAPGADLSPPFVHSPSRFTTVPIVKSRPCRLARVVITTPRLDIDRPFAN